MLRRLAGPPLDYSIKLLSYAPIAYWPLWEATGSTANDISGNAYHGTYEGVTLAQSGIGDGRTCPLFDGASDGVDVYSTAFRDAFNGAEGSITLWGKVYDAAVWTDAAQRYLLNFRVGDGNNHVYFIKQGIDNRLDTAYTASGTSEVVQLTSYTSTDWFFLASTWSKLAEEFKFFLDGTQSGSTQTSLGTWAGTLSSSITVLSGWNTNWGNSWNGWLAHVAVWDTPLTPTQIADLAEISA